VQSVDSYVKKGIAGPERDIKQVVIKEEKKKRKAGHIFVMGISERRQVGGGKG
jgi:hypothetical protein